MRLLRKSLKNNASRQLQISVGFNERPFYPFNDFINDGQIMYELQIPNNLSVVPATTDEAYFVRVLFALNKDRLDVGDIRMEAWLEILTEERPDVKHFLICKGAVPIAYMRIVKIEESNKTKISMFLLQTVLTMKRFIVMEANLQVDMFGDIKL